MTGAPDTTLLKRLKVDQLPNLLRSPLDTLVAGCGGGKVDGAARGRLNLMLWLLVMRPGFF